MSRRLTIVWMAAACLISAAVTGAAAQGYPSRPVILTVGAAPGGVADVVAKGFAQALTRELGQPVTVENRSSFSGSEAAEMVQAARPDGYRLLIFSGAQHVALPVIRQVAYDPLQGFAPVTNLFTLVNFLAVSTKSPATTVAQLVELGKSKPQGLTFASSGLGSTSHLTAMNIGIASNIRILPTHFAGARPMLNDVIVNRLDFTLVSYAVAKRSIDAGQLKLLAVDSPERWPDRPEVPTLKEAGIDQDKVASWFGVAAPTGTPAPIVRRLHDAFAKAAAVPALITLLRENGVVVSTSTPEELQAMMTRESQVASELIKKLNIKQQ